MPFFQLPSARSSVSRPPRARPTWARAVRLLLASTALVASAPALPAAGAGPSGAVGGDPTPVGSWPLEPRPTVVQGFDPPVCSWCPGHRGVDLGGYVVEPVTAVLGGTVRYAGLVAGHGVVVVDHGATRTTYEPVSATVHRGDPVRAGAALGRLDVVGSHCFPAACLHLGLIRNSDDAYLDPLTMLPTAPEPVRLLPLWRDLWLLLAPLPVRVALGRSAPRAMGAALL